MGRGIGGRRRAGGAPQPHQKPVPISGARRAGERRRRKRAMEVATEGARDGIRIRCSLTHSVKLTMVFVALLIFVWLWAGTGAGAAAADGGEEE